ncbi:hypothetical protein CTI12_AA390110 [Artemisia annua]|uniref:Uncharacterized protein n=1 Tax=Artemisia annua TaxID=35608 RepID=A0A2U1MEV3_ARTAN|nr:hypothetical protein CTI12_AA390110 [Artemisia annua]
MASKATVDSNSSLPTAKSKKSAPSKCQTCNNFVVHMRLYPPQKGLVSISDAINSEYGVGSNSGTMTVEDEKVSSMSESDGK